MWSWCYAAAEKKAASMTGAETESPRRGRGACGGRGASRGRGERSGPACTSKTSAVVCEVRSVRDSAGGGADAFGSRAGTKTSEQEAAEPQAGPTRPRPAPAQKQENRKYFTEVPHASCSHVPGTARGGSSCLLFSCFRHGARRLLMPPVLMFSARRAEAPPTGDDRGTWTLSMSSGARMSVSVAETAFTAPLLAAVHFSLPERVNLHPPRV